MHLRARVLTGLLLAACAAPLLAAHDPLPHAAGVWKGTASSGEERFSLTVTLKKVNSSVFISCNVRSGSGQIYQVAGEAFLKAEGRYVAVNVQNTALPVKFDVYAQPLSGTGLAVTSMLGEGELNFLYDFMKAEFTFRSMGNTVNASLTRLTPPEPEKTKGGGKAAKIKGPSMPPLQIAPQ